MREPTPYHIYIDDNLLADPCASIESVLVAVAEAVFQIMGFPVQELQQCVVSLKKWRTLRVSHRPVLLGLAFDTRLMRVMITDEYRAKVLHLLKTT